MSVALTQKQPKLFFQNINYLHQTSILDKSMGARNYFEMLEYQPILIKISFKCTKHSSQHFYHILVENKLVYG